MKKIFCSCCGSSKLIFENGYYKCQFCKSKFTEGFSDSKMFVELCQADNERQSAQFEKAKIIYSNIIKKYPSENLTSAFWGLFLCENNVIFEEDGKGEKFPSFYNINPISIFETNTYKNAIIYADENSKEDLEIFKSLAEKIENARKNYLQISKNTKPYDIFICYKSTDQNGNFTKDRQIAMEIYNEFSSKYRIFFSEKSLSDIKSYYRDYEPNIYYGLYTSKIMLLICSKREFLDSQWLKNEWSRFSKINNVSQEKCIIPIFCDNFDPNMLPSDLWHKQGYFDDIKLINNLKNQFESILNPTNILDEIKKEQERQKLEQEQIKNYQEQVLQNRNIDSNSLQFVITDDNLDSYISAIKTFINSENYQKANEYLTNLKISQPDVFEGYYYSLFSKNKVNKIEDLALKKDFSNDTDFENAKLFAIIENQKQLVNSLSIKNKEYLNFLVEKNTKALKNENFEEFCSNYEILDNFAPNHFYKYYFGLFKKYKKSFISDLAKIANIKKDELYLQANQNSFGYEQIIDSFNNEILRYFDSIVQKIEKNLIHNNFDNFKNAYIELKNFDNDCFETAFYNLYYVNNVASIVDLAKIPNLQNGKDYFEILEKRTSKKHFNLIEELEKEIENANSLLIFDVKNSFSIKDQKQFRKNYEKLKKYINNFDTYYYGIFYENNVMKVGELKKISDLLEQSNYVNAKKYAQTKENQDLILEIENLYNQNCKSDFSVIEKEFDKISNFDTLLNTYKRLNDASGIVTKSKIKQIFYKYFVDIYYKNLILTNEIIDTTLQNLINFDGNSKQLIKIYDTTNATIKALFSGASSIYRMFVYDNFADEKENTIQILEELLIKKNCIFVSKIKYLIEILVKKENSKRKISRFGSIISLIGIVLLIVTLTSQRVVKLENFTEFFKYGKTIFYICFGIDFLVVCECFSYKLLNNKFSNKPIKISLSILLTIGFSLLALLTIFIFKNNQIAKYIFAFLSIIPFIESIMICALINNALLIILYIILILVLYVKIKLRIIPINSENVIDKKVKYLNIFEMLVLYVGIASIIYVGILLIKNIGAIENFKIYFTLLKEYILEYFNLIYLG